MDAQARNDRLEASDGAYDVLYVAGQERSGSTLLGEILGATEGVFVAGEVRHLWGLGLGRDRLCACGERVRRCPVWSEVLEAAVGRVPGPDDPLVEEMVETGPEPSDAVGMALPGGAARTRRRRPDHIERLDRLYAAIRDVTGADVVVDTSKYPLYGRYLDAMPSHRVAIVHLVRDPRGVAHSRTKEKAQPDPDEDLVMTTYAPWRTAVGWAARTVGASLLWRGRDDVLVLRYEDLARAPQEAVEAVLDLAGVDPDDDPFLGPRRVDLGTSHTVWGNPLRFEEDPIEVRPDRAWRRRLDGVDRTVVTALTWPLLLRYGYPLRPDGDADAAADPGSDGPADA